MVHVHALAHMAAEAVMPADACRPRRVGLREVTADAAAKVELRGSAVTGRRRGHWVQRAGREAELLVAEGSHQDGHDDVLRRAPQVWMCAFWKMCGEPSGRARRRPAAGVAGVVCACWKMCVEPSGWARRRLAAGGKSHNYACVQMKK
eukprot:365169-Chlamydomonas_euryale.AAC.3